MDRRKRARYAATILELGDHAPLEVDLRRPPHDHDPDRIAAVVGAPAFTVITAENPGGTERPADENAAATAALRRLLERAEFHFVAAAGRDPDSDHREEGFAVAGRLDLMLVLARRLLQDAVFRFEGGRFLLVDARDGQATVLPIAPGETSSAS